MAIMCFITHTHTGKCDHFSRKLKEMTGTNPEVIQMLEFAGKHFVAACYKWGQRYKGKYTHHE